MSARMYARRVESQKLYVRDVFQRLYVRDVVCRRLHARVVICQRNCMPKNSRVEECEIKRVSRDVS